MKIQVPGARLLRTIQGVSRVETRKNAPRPAARLASSARRSILDLIFERVDTPGVRPAARVRPRSLVALRLSPGVCQACTTRLLANTR